MKQSQAERLASLLTEQRALEYRLAIVDHEIEVLTEQMERPKIIRSTPNKEINHDDN